MKRNGEPRAIDRDVAVGALVGSALRRAEEFPLESDELRTLILTCRMTFADVARMILPAEYAENNKLAQMTVSHAARDVLSDEEYEIARMRGHHEGCKRGGLAFHPVLLEQKPAESYTYPENLRKDDWSADDFSRLVALADQYRYNGGMHDGKPCFTIIAEHFPDRSPNACARRYGRYIKELEKSGNGELESDP